VNEVGFRTEPRRLCRRLLARRLLRLLRLLGRLRRLGSARRLEECRRAEHGDQERTRGLEHGHLANSGLAGRSVLHADERGVFPDARAPGPVENPNKNHFSRLALLL
jgi:hypothetical protein